MPEQVEVWSCGGGVQSVAIGVLIGEGRLPVPDISAIVDTGREVQSTWNYLRDHLNPYLMATRGIWVTTVPATFKRVDLFTKDGEMIMPAYTATGRLGAFCSGEWKRDAMERYLRSQGVKTARQWLGFSTEESRRAKGKAHRPWLQPRYPLIELGIDRTECLALIARAGLPRPLKSRCWMCPHQDAQEWAEIKANPDEWAKAVALDEQIRESDQAGDVFLHSSRQPLSMVNLSSTHDTPVKHCDDSGCYT